MKFYSGFALTDDKRFFTPYLREGEYRVAGFSYGAIKAFLHVKESKTRIDTLQLFSPAFFQDRDVAFKKLQLLGYKKGSERYLQNFLKSCFYPYEQESVAVGEHSVEALRELLYFEWSETALREIVDRGVTVELYLGEKDAVIDARRVKAFFQPYATIYLIKDANHFLYSEPKDR